MESTVSGHYDFSSRIGARAVTAGAVASLAAASTLMLLGYGLGIAPSGPLTAEAAHRMGLGFAAWAALSWIIAGFAGGWLAAAISRSTSRRDGLLHGAITWALGFLFASVFAWGRLMAAHEVGVVNREFIDALRSNGLFFGVFLASALALCASLVGGAAGARSEVRAFTREPIGPPHGREPLPTGPRAPQPV